MKKTFYWIDREWYDNELNRTIGDMGYSFCDAADTITENRDELIDGIKEYANDVINDGKELDDEDYLADNANFPISYVLKADFEIEEEDDKPFLQDMDDDTKEIVFSCAYCTSKRAKEIAEKGFDLNCDYYAGDYYAE